MFFRTFVAALTILTFSCSGELSLDSLRKNVTDPTDTSGARTNEGMDLLDTNNKCDYLILTHDSFYAEALRLYDHRLSTHPRSCIVTTQDVSSTFDSTFDINRIRAFIAYAYENWRVPPTYILLIGDANMDVAEPFDIDADNYNFIPAPLEYNSFYYYNANHFYARDDWYVKSPIVGERKPIMHIGRIPARDNAQLANAIDKIIYYDGITDEPEWLGRILMLVGDRNYTVDNTVYRVLHDDYLMPEVSNWDPEDENDPLVMYSSEYEEMDWPENSTDDTRAAWNQGYGLVNAFGNTKPNMLVLMAEFFYSGDPVFTHSLDTTGFLPLVFSGSCLTNHFHTGDTINDDCIGEDLILSESDRGAIAVIGATHMNNIAEVYDLNRIFLQSLIHEGTRNVGRLLSTIKARAFDSGFGEPTFIKQYSLLGDPATNVKLYPLPHPASYENGIEIDDSPIIRDEVIEKSAGITSDNTRVAHVEGGVSPVMPERMLKVALTDEPGSADYIEWIIEDSINIPITRNMHFSYWINVVESPAGMDKIALDGSTVSGNRIKDASIVDQNGQRLDAKLREPIPDGWQLVYVDLSPLEGEVIKDLRIRYETTDPSETGSLLAYFDEIMVEQMLYDCAAEEILNYSFENDRDENGTPDFWTNKSGETATPVAVQYNEAHEGEHGMLVFNIYCLSDEGAQHVFHTNSDIPEYSISFWHFAHQPTTFRFKLVDADTGDVLDDCGGPCNYTVGASQTWAKFSTSFQNPSYMSGSGRIKIKFLPDVCIEPVLIDDVHVHKPMIVGVP